MRGVCNIKINGAGSIERRCIGQRKHQDCEPCYNMPVTVDTSKFSAMCKELAAKCNAPDDRVLRSEVGKVLSRAVELTPAADSDKIRQHSDQAVYSLQPASLYAPKAKRRKAGSKVLYKLTNRYPDPLWAKLSQARAQDLRKRIKARGLAKGSWWKIGQLLGLQVEAPGYAKSAVPMTGKNYPEDEKARSVRQGGEAGYEIENSQPTVYAIGGEGILQRAIDGRVGFFLTNLSKDVFASWDKIAKKYPGVRTDG
jgi:hypothetical protein